MPRIVRPACCSTWALGCPHSDSEAGAPDPGRQLVAPAAHPASPHPWAEPPPLGETLSDRLDPLVASCRPASDSEAGAPAQVGAPLRRPRLPRAPTLGRAAPPSESPHREPCQTVWTPLVAPCRPPSDSEAGAPDPGRQLVAPAANPARPMPGPSRTPPLGSSYRGCGGPWPPQNNFFLPRRKKADLGAQSQVGLRAATAVPGTGTCRGEGSAHRPAPPQLEISQARPAPCRAGGQCPHPAWGWRPAGPSTEPRCRRP